MQTRQTYLQQILVAQIDYYLTELNPPASAHSSFIGQNRAASGKRGRERAYRYKWMIEHAEDDYSLARRVFNDMADMHVKSSINLQGSTVLRKLMLKGLCDFFKISADRIREQAQYQCVVTLKGSHGHYVPPLDLDRAAFTLLHREITKMRAPRELHVLLRNPYSR